MFVKLYLFIITQVFFFHTIHGGLQASIQNEDGKVTIRWTSLLQKMYDNNDINDDELEEEGMNTAISC